MGMSTAQTFTEIPTSCSMAKDKTALFEEFVVVSEPETRGRRPLHLAELFPPHTLRSTATAFFLAMIHVLGRRDISMSCFQSCTLTRESGWLDIRQDLTQKCRRRRPCLIQIVRRRGTSPTSTTFTVERPAIT